MKLKNALKLEELAMFVLGFAGYIYFGAAWWAFLPALLLPDLSMLGYLKNSLVGAYTYNVVHHKGVAIFVFMLGMVVNSDLLIFAGIIMFAHASADRVLGYGLKYRNDFHSTHLGWLNQRKIVFKYSTRGN